MKRTKLLCLLFTLVMLFGLVSCSKGGDETPKKDAMIIGDYEVLYKNAKIMEASNGKDVLIITSDFTNNSKKAITYLDSILDWAEQDRADLEYADTLQYSLSRIQW